MLRGLLSRSIFVVRCVYNPSFVIPVTSGKRKQLNLIRMICHEHQKVPKRLERLPDIALPSHYTLIFTPDLEKFVFQGEEVIDVQVTKPTDYLKLHASAIDIQKASVTLKDGTEWNGLSIDYDQKWELITIRLPTEVQPQEIKISLVFTGILNDIMRGFYRSSYKDAGDVEKFMASTQFESSHARMCFPCWDEPIYKAKFDISLIVEQSLTALSNMNCIDEKIINGKKFVKFATSPLMSTYLVALVVGDLEFIEDKTNSGCIVRVYSTRGKKDKCYFALSVLKKTIGWYSDWFGIPYALPKCDMVAIPDFSMQAMENWGLLTFRELAVLTDPKKTSKRLETLIALVIAHEAAHLWFGNLVTMKWWTDLWLKEGFASFMEYMFVDANYPEYNVWLNFLNDELAHGFQLDALKSSHPIEIEIDNPNELDEIYDSITYSKSNSIIRMLCNMLGVKKFQEGLRIYLKRYQYKNAETVDLWDALSETSGLDVREFMSGWTKQMGYPLVVVQQEKKDGGIILHLRQEKFSFNPKQTNDTIWQVPITIASVSDPDNIKKILLLKNRENKFIMSEFKADDCLKLNVGTTGFYRVCYDCGSNQFATLYQCLREKKLSALDRFGLVCDMVAWLISSRHNAKIFLQLIEDLVNEDEYSVWSEINCGLAKILDLSNYYADKSIHNRLLSYIASRLEPVGMRLKWESSEDEEPQRKFLRSLILQRLASCNHLPTIDKAQKIFREHIDKNFDLNPDLRSMIYSTVAMYGGQAIYDELKQIYEKAELDEIKRHCILAMARIQDVNILKQLFNYSIVERRLRTQEYPVLFAGASLSNIGQKFLWPYFKDNVKLLVKNIGTVNSKLFINCYKSSADWMSFEGSTDDVQKFICSHLKEDEARTLNRTTEQILETISINTQMLKSTESDVSNFLTEKGF